MSAVSSTVKLPSESGSAPPRASWWNDNGVIFWLLIAACVIPPWTARYFPSQDGSEHLYNALILRDYAAPWAGLFRKYLYLNPHPVPSLLPHWLLAGLMFVVRPNEAEKLLLSLYIVMFPLSVRYVLRPIARANGFLTFLSFPLIYSLMFHKGLFSFCLSMPLYFFFVGYWLRRRGQFDWRSAPLLLVLSLLLYSTHVVSLAEAYATVGLIALVQVASEWRRRWRGEGTIPPLGEMFWSMVGRPFLALAPTLCLLLWFLSRQNSDTPNPGGGQQAHLLHHWSDLLKGLLTLTSLVSYHKVEGLCAQCVALLFLGLGVLGVLWHRITQSRWARLDLLLGIGAALVFYFITPDSAGGGALITPRLQLYCYFLLLLFLASASYPRWSRIAAPLAATLLCLYMLATYTVQYKKYNVYLADYMSCATVPAFKSNSTLLPICISEVGYLASGRPLSLRSRGVHIFLHFSTRLGIEKRLVVLKIYEATKNYFPTLFRPELTVDGRIGKFGKGLIKYPSRTDYAGRIDYVLVWDMREPDPEGAKYLAHAQQELDEGGYKLIYTSPLGFGKLYQHVREWPHGDRGTALQQTSVRSLGGQYQQEPNLSGRPGGFPTAAAGQETD